MVKALAVHGSNVLRRKAGGLKCAISTIYDSLAFICGALQRSARQRNLLRKNVEAVSSPEKTNLPVALEEGVLDLTKRVCPLVPYINNFYCVLLRLVPVARRFCHKFAHLCTVGKNAVFGFMQTHPIKRAPRHVPMPRAVPRIPHLATDAKVNIAPALWRRFERGFSRITRHLPFLRL